MLSNNEINVLNYLKEQLVVPRNWEIDDVEISYSRNMLIHPYDRRNYIIKHKEKNETVYASLILEEIKIINNKQEQLYWKDVFNSSHMTFTDIFKCFEIVRNSGYDYFVFESKVYKILKDNSFVEIPYSVDKIK